MAVKGILEVSKILNDYAYDIQDAITLEAEQVAKKGMNELKNTQTTYKVRTGKYNKGWRVATTKGRGFVDCVIHNSTNYQLTHLLEKGHDWVGRDGTRKKNAAKPYVHIAPVEEKCVKEYQQGVETIIKNGG